jgi:hypothetical protein
MDARSRNQITKTETTMEKLTITLITGKEVTIERGSYVVRIFRDGMWQNVCAFPRTEDGYTLATSVVKYAHDAAYIRIAN